MRTRPFPAAYWDASVVGEEELALVTEAIRSRCLFRDYGEDTPHMAHDLEREARAYLGAAHALGVTSGSIALYCAMAGLGLGDEVLIPSLIWRSESQAPLVGDATPVFVEIDRSLGLDPADLEARITLFIDPSRAEMAQTLSRALAAEGLQLGATTHACNMLAHSWVLERRQAHPSLPPFGPGCPGEGVRYRRDPCPRSDEILASMVCIPIAPWYTDGDIDDILAAAAKVWGRYGG